MKRLLLPLIATLALPTAVEANWFGKHNSRYDANEACEIWMLKGFKYTYKVIEEKGLSNNVPRHENPQGIDIDADIKHITAISKWYEESRKKVEKTKSGFSRSCLEEKETKQFIGRAKSCLKKKEYSVEEWGKLFELKSCEKRKYFKY